MSHHISYFRIPEVASFKAFFLKSTFLSLARENELSSLSGYFYFFLGAFFAATLFEPTTAAIALAASILGDVFSAPIGLYLKRVKKVRRERSIEGSLAGGFAILSLLLVGAFPSAWVLVASATFVITDFLKPKRLDDNLLFPLVIGAAVYLHRSIS